LSDAGLCREALLFHRHQRCRPKDASWEGEPVPARGYLYLEALYIEEVQAHWPDAAKAQGKWHLLTERNESISDNLEKLERALYAWALSNGCGD
jgi:hypothetical protein